MSYNAKNYTEQGGDVTHFGGKVIFEEGSQVEGLPTTVPDASTTEKGVVKMAENQAEYEDANIVGLQTAFNHLLQKLKAAGIMAPDAT